MREIVLSTQQPSSSIYCQLLAIAGSLFFSLLLAFPVYASADQLIFNTQEFAPFNYTKNGKVVGPAADIIRRICSDTQMTCAMKSYPWRRAQNNVKNGQANALFVIGWNKGRTLWLDYSPPLLNTEYGFFVNVSNKKLFNTIADIDGMKVGVFGPSNTSRSLDKLSISTLKDITIDMTAGDIAAFRKLAVNRVGAVYSNREVGKSIIQKYNLSGSIRYALSQRKLKYYIGFSKKYAPKALVKKFNNQFIKLYHQGVIQSILKKYNMSPATLK